MVTVFSAMRRLAGSARDQVIMPAYTCYSVPAAAARAGLRPVLCDIDPRTLSMDLRRLEELDYSRVLTIVTANLYGLPNALTELEALARRKGVYLLDDAAQSLGARVAGRPVGGFGDVGLYSFDKGKNITTIQGGVAVSRNVDLIREMSSVFAATPPPRGTTTLAAAVKLGLYSFFLRPALYDVVRRLPGLRLGITPYEVEYPVTRFSGRLAAIASRLALRLADLNGVRQQNAERLRRALWNLPGITLIDALAGAEPVYVRFPILVEAAATRDPLIAKLQRAGIGATGSYPLALADVPEVAVKLVNPEDRFDGARTVASTIITVPTHAYCPPNLAENVRDTMLSSV
jgi:dTDP-4-amino-4,6-dideoxygalactose transaminase